jgi:protein subunit release factor B
VSLPPLTDEALLAECDVIPFRGSGPGGQHRNKVETGVRLLHRPTGLVAQASERRSRLQNLGVALDRLRVLLTARFAPPPPPRRPTRPSRGATERRHATKRIRAAVKQGRGKPGGDHD